MVYICHKRDQGVAFQVARDVIDQKRFLHHKRHWVVVMPFAVSFSAQKKQSSKRIIHDSVRVVAIIVSSLFSTSQ